MSSSGSNRYAFPKLVVRDLDRQIAFYRAVIGYQGGQFIDGVINGQPIREIVFFNDQNQVELLLLSYTDPTAPNPNPSGVISGYFTDDLDAFEQRVLSAGGSVFQPIGPLEIENGAGRLAFYTDPEGHLLEVIEA